LVADTADFAAECRQVNKTYRTAASEVAALVNVDVAFPRATMTAIIGPSGSGKSSLLRLLACLDRPDSGTVEVGGVIVSSLGARARRRLRRRLIGYVFQQPAHNLLPYLEASEHVAMAARLRGQRDDTDELLDMVGLADRRDHKPAQLSGGEQQRLAFAVAVAGNPPIVVADEPTAELDHATGARLIEDMLRLRDRGTSLVVSSHDPEVTAVADRTVRIDFGHLRQMGR
jgi:ABC-type lipoprotein export system ATPase subunit